MAGRSFIIPIYKNKILIHKKKQGKWGFFGGGANKDETYEACAKREFYEETGFKVDMDFVRMHWGRGKVKFCMFRTPIKFIVLRNSEVLDYAWVDVKEVENKKSKYEMTKQARKLIEHESFQCIYIHIRD